MKNTTIKYGILISISVVLFMELACCRRGHQSGFAKVSYYGNPSALIAAGVIVPAGKKIHFTSGVTCPVADSTAPEGTRERFGDTKVQAIGILNTLKSTLANHGLTMHHVIYLRVYIAPDKYNNNTIDFKSWNEAYSQFFGNADNPVKPARSTVGIASLINPDKLIEIELIAVYP